jgi:L-ascorbate metabolism protein UlaG (beta-lactamase superfamily)
LRRKDWTGYLFSHADKRLYVRFALDYKGHFGHSCGRFGQWDIAPLPRVTPECLSHYRRQQGTEDEATGESKEEPRRLDRRHCHSIHFRLACEVFTQTPASYVNMRRIT